MSGHRRIIRLSFCLGLALASQAHAELSASLDHEMAKLAISAPGDRQFLINETESALRQGVSEQDLSRLAGLAITRNYTSEDVASFVQKIVELKRNEVPPALVLDKILEGMAKRVPATTILHVASLWSAALETSSSQVQSMEKKGLIYVTPAQRTALINAGATLQQVYGAGQAFSALGSDAEVSGRIVHSAASIIAAAQFTETLLLYGASPDQALLLSGASLRANYNSQRIQGLQHSVLDQLQHGLSVTDIIAAQRSQFASRPIFPHAPGGAVDLNPGVIPGGPSIGAPGNGGRPGGFSSGAPGGGFPGMSGRGMSGGGGLMGR